MAGRSVKERPLVIVVGDVGTVQTALGRFPLMDADDAKRVGAHSWHTNNAGYVYTWINKKHIAMHRFILGVSDPSIYVDHINCIKFDCRKSNLRLCTPAQNNMNRGASIHKRKGVIYKGVFQVSGASTWRAALRVNGKQLHLGSFLTQEEAAKVYDEAAKKHHGEFARLNFPSLQ